MAKFSFDLEDLLKKADEAERFWGPIYDRGESDTAFVLGDQWPKAIKAEREKSSRPCLTENRTLPFVHQVINQIRQARPSIIPKPVDDKADVESAEVLRGTIRNIETISDANTVYDTAARNSVMGAVGWIRIITEYADYDTFDQDVKLERINNPRSVMLDPNHTRQDGADARYGFVYDDMSVEEFKDAYPDAVAVGFNKGGWGDSSSIRVAEYFEKRFEDKKLVEFEYDTLAGRMRGVKFAEEVPAGAVVLRERTTQVCKIKYCKFTQLDILEEGEFAGEYIPLVPVYGFEVFVDGKRNFYSLIHPAKDPQMMLNFWKSAATEVVALQPKTPYIGLVGQFKTYGDLWASANQENLPFLEADPVYDVNGNPLPILPQRQPPATSSGTMMQEAAMSSEAIKASLGMFDAAMGNNSNDISGKAVISRQLQGDNATYHFVDNLAVAIRQVGRILIGLIPLIYTGNRIIRILGDDGAESLVPLNRPVVKEGKQYKPANDPNMGKIISFDAGKYDVVVEVGASYATKRQELANAIVELARVNPEIMNVAGDILMKSLDVPYAEEISKRIRATMNPALLGDDAEAMRLQEMTAALEALQQKLADTEGALLAKRNNEEFKNELEAKKVELQAKQLEIDAAKTMADIQKIQSEIGLGGGAAISAVAQTLTDLQARYDDIAGALDVLLTAKEEEGTGPLEVPA